MIAGVSTSKILMTILDLYFVEDMLFVIPKLQGPVHHFSIFSGGFLYYFSNSASLKGAGREGNWSCQTDFSQCLPFPLKFKVTIEAPPKR